MKRILVIDDEKNMARFIELELKHEGFEVTCVYDGRSGLQLALTEDWDVILLDIMLPQLSGIEVCRRIRQEKNTPIIMLTARDSVLDRVSGLDNGADDYIPKPFAIEELLARIRSLFRRLTPNGTVAPSTRLTFQNVVLDVEAHLVHQDGQPIELTKTEYDLLLLFMQNINRVLTRDVILDKVWGYQAFVETNIVDVYVRYLRNKLDRDGGTNLIQTVRGMGYVMRE